MDDVLLRVRPLAGGWMVDSSGALQALQFHAGGRAEAQAHRLARAIALSGDDARVVVHDRLDRVVGSRRYFAEAS